MKNVLSIIVFLAMSLPLFSVTVDGYAFLEGETDHSGIEVFFQRVAPDTLYSNTAYTDASGYYSVVVDNGWYDVEYRSSGFISKDTTDVSLYSDQTLGDQTLLKEGLSIVTVNLRLIFSANSSTTSMLTSFPSRIIATRSQILCTSSRL